MRALILLLLIAAPLAAQTGQLTFDAIYEPVKKVNFSGSIQTGFEWVDETTFVWPKKNAADGFAGWTAFDTVTGRERPLFDEGKMEAALVAAGVAKDLAAKAARSDELVFDPKKTALLAEIGDDLWLYSIARGTAARLTSTPGREEESSFSPDGRRIAFVRGNNLFVAGLDGTERQLTTDGAARVLNGKLDWIYQEEIFGRGIFKAYWWSPDSSRIAFLRLDDSSVPDYTVVDHIPYRPLLETGPYPKAGDPNPLASLRIVRVAGGEPAVVDNERYTGGEHLIVDVTWRPDSAFVFYQVQDREQTWLDLVSADPDGKSTVLLRETTKAWVEQLGPPVWTDGGFLWQSERSGWRHLYHYAGDGTLLRQVTKGEWEVRALHGFDAKKGLVYFSATERSPIGLDVYRVRLDGSSMQRLSQAAGTHEAAFNGSCTLYVDRWSDIATPDQARVHRADGKVLHVVDANRVAELEALALPRPQFLQVRTRDGFPMEALILRPRDFDPSKKYPVYQFLYGGPRAQQVTNRWRGQPMLFNRLLADQGAIVWMCDNRSASGKGAVSAWTVYKNLGELELRDTLDALDWLAGQPGVDGSRVVLNGYSYGGFMVAYALTHSDRFAGGIAGGPVTDWRDYDSVYTERHLLMPQNNPDGYRKSSPRFDAKNLHGKLLLIHGTTDDNVHLQNTIQMAHELQEQGRMFEMMLLPQTRHSVKRPETLAFLQKVVFEFVKKNLGLPPPPVEP